MTTTDKLLPICAVCGKEIAEGETKYLEVRLGEHILLPHAKCVEQKKAESRKLDEQAASKKKNLL